MTTRRAFLVAFAVQLLSTGHCFLSSPCGRISQILPLTSPARTNPRSETTTLRAQRRKKSNLQIIVEGREISDQDIQSAIQTQVESAAQSEYAVAEGLQREAPDKAHAAHDAHHNYPRVLLHADRLGRDATKRILNVLPKQKALVSTTAEWKRLQRHASETISQTHLRDLLKDEERCDSMFATHDGVYYDYSRQQATSETMDLLFNLAEKQELTSRIDQMFSGEKINFTEDRAVLHTALRAPRDEAGTVFVDGLDAIKEVHEVLDQIKAFTEAFRSGQITGYTGKRMRNIVSVGIGGSYLGPEFLHEVLKTEAEGVTSSLGYSLRFLANVDPVDVERTCADLDPEETLIIVVSKTFTTAETMLNARTMRQWLWDFMGDDIDVVRKHVVACSSVSATDKVAEFGIDTENYFFRFWDWVGGRYSVCGAAGAVPISLLYGFDIFRKFLDGARSMDQHFRNAPMRENIPIIMGLLGVWNSS
ncbi:hypothetical protein THAOC_01689 [Thalassiosira oceanica]|uniref:Glucose-6-phosphate isomerase n=1 Tax=Thalassiosira oceanica TaxID=159749 RepID=K0TQS2_THAOC|nr:hypothetical protein THAOC_01689 [Thalassiosira oceanica]|eukprot:EJK76542.1 hypothetical protein THAOC_01689 [Thalassiosira oceanica]